MAGREGAPNWEAIRQEYIETDISMRALAEKHGVKFTTLSKRAEREKWSGLRKEVVDKASTILLQDAANNRARIAALSDDIGIEVMELVLGGIRELKKTNSSSVTRSFVSKPKDKKDGKDLPPVSVSEVRNLGTYTSAAASVLRALGLDAASELSRERFEFQKAQDGAKDDTDTFNENMISLAELINHPMPDRTMEQIEGKGAASDPQDRPSAVRGSAADLEARRASNLPKGEDGT